MNGNSGRRFRVALSADYVSADGIPRAPNLGLDLFREHAGIEHFVLPEFHAVTAPDQLEQANGYLTMDAGVNESSLRRAGDLIAVGRFGMGYEDIDVAACTAADVAVFNCPGSVNRSMAEATLAWMFALSFKVLQKDRQVRAGNWGMAPPASLGRELRDRIFGTIGFGGIGREVHRLLKGLGLKSHLAFDPYADPAVAEQLGVRMVVLKELLSTADFVSVHCPKNASTIDLVSTEQLAVMKPGAFLINTARGGIVNEDALYAALEEGRLAGAAIDTFVGEPFNQPHRFSRFENVILAPHSIGHTEELFRDIGLVACASMIQLAEGRAPVGLLNREVLARPSFQQKWERLRV
jgi:phosphoglycerate dehydrogenase-like enzyme